MLPAFGGALIGYGIASSRRGLVVAGVVVVLATIALQVAAVAATKGVK